MARVRRLLRDREDGREHQKQFEDEVRAAAAVQQSLFPGIIPWSSQWSTRPSAAPLTA